jgi:DNA-binding GntR family transcriptional regulator
VDVTSGPFWIVKFEGKMSASMKNKVNSLIELNPTIPFQAPLADRVYEALKHRILTCSLLPGQRIIDKILCAELGISRTPLREAENRLCLEGLLIQQTHHGYSIAPVTVEDFRDLCELRRIIEPEVAGLAAERATPGDIDELLNAAELAYTHGHPITYEGYLRGNSAFHLALVRCARNARVEGVVMSALDQHQRPLYLGLDSGIDAEASSAEHREIVAAVKTRDAARAIGLMKNHISRGEERIVNALRLAGY